MAGGRILHQLNQQASIPERPLPGPATVLLSQGRGTRENTLTVETLSEID
jgi:hypothetical protein